MSWQLVWLNRVLRLVAKPRLRHTGTPEQAARDFDRTSLLLRRPSHLRHLKRSGGLDWICAGTCEPGRVILYFHGGGYVTGSPVTHEGLAGRLSRLSRTEVCAPDYPLVQVQPFPGFFDAAVAAWDRLMALGYAPAAVALAGDSAGGGLALALLSHLCEAGTPPACLIAFSPWTDLAMTGQSLRDNAKADPFLPVERIEELVEIVAGDADPRDARLSPLYGSFPDCPPVLIQHGETEILRDDSVRMAQRLRDFGAEVTEEAHPTAPHAWVMFDGWIPEARDSLRSAAHFLQASLDAASR